MQIEPEQWLSKEKELSELKELLRKYLVLKSVDGRVERRGLRNELRAKVGMEPEV